MLTIEEANSILDNKKSTSDFSSLLHNCTVNIIYEDGSTFNISSEYLKIDVKVVKSDSQPTE